MYNVEKNVVKSELTREGMEKLWSTKYLLGQEEREIATGM